MNFKRLIKSEKFRDSERNFRIFLGLWTIFFISLKIIQHLSFNTNALDLSLFVHAITNSCSGSIMYEPFHTQQWANFFSVHFMPILLFFVPLFKIFSGTFVLLISQVLAVSAAALFLFRICKSESGSVHLSFAIALIFLLYRPLLNGLMYDFHPEMFFPLFIFAGFYYLRAKPSDLLFILSITGALLIKEDYAVYTLFFLIFLFFLTKKKITLLMICISTVYIIAVFLFIIPHFRSEAGLTNGYGFLGSWSSYGKTCTEILVNILQNPISFIKDIDLPRFLYKSLNVFAPLLFLPFLSGYSILLLPPLTAALLSRITLMSSFGLYYSSSLIPFIFIALIFSVIKIRDKEKSHSILKNKTNTIIIILILISLLNFKWTLLNPEKHENIRHYKDVKAALETIPKDSSVSAQSALIPHLPVKKETRVFPDVKNSDLIIIHTDLNPWPLTEEKLRSRNLKIQRDKKYKLIKSIDNLFIYIKK